MTNIQRQRELQERIADDERHAATAHKAAAYDDLLTRAEAAEAERDELHERYGNLNAAYVDLVIKNTEHGNRMYAAERRVAELETEVQLARATTRAAVERVAELQAAAQWRPVTDSEPADGETVELLVRGRRADGLWYYNDEQPPIVAYRPIPPLPDATEGN